MTASDPHVPAIELLGARVHPLTVAQLNALVAEAIDANQRWVIANHNLHSLYLLHHDEGMRDFFDAAQVAHIDGMPLVWLGRWFGHRLRRDQRVTYMDWVFPLLALAASQGWRVFHLGARPGVGERAARALQAQLPALQIRVHHGYFETRGPENEAVLAALADAAPQILMVGMGMPRQERWIRDNLDRIPANVILPAGACFDFVAGEVPVPPRWLGGLGLEWAYRLAVEPRRLWRRYLVEPWYVAWLVGREVVTRKRRGLSRRR